MEKKLPVDAIPRDQENVVNMSRQGNNNNFTREPTGQEISC